MPVTEFYRAETLHEGLGEPFFDRVEPASFPQHRLRYRNQRWAARVGLDGLTDAEWIEHFGRFRAAAGQLRASVSAALSRPSIPRIQR